jgi:hypothetical protein
VYLVRRTDETITRHKIFPQRLQIPGWRDPIEPFEKSKNPNNETNENISKISTRRKEQKEAQQQQRQQQQQAAINADKNASHGVFL